MKLHESPNDFLAAIQATSQATGIREVFVEKDYWVCFVLKNLSKSSFKNDVIFKGGTSLSKAHKIIHRFSEDVDLALLDNSGSDNQIKKKLKAIEEAIASPPLNSIEKNGITSKGSRFRKTVWKYHKNSKGDYGDASPDLLLEINSFAIPTPYHPASVQTYIADHLGQQQTITEFELQPFQVNVLDIKRTFAEKVSAVAKASFGDSTHGELKKKIRHLYDLAMLLRHPPIQEFINSSTFKEVHEQVRKDDWRVSGGQVNHAEKDFRDAPIYRNPKAVIDLLRSTYEGQFKTLVYKPEDMPSITEITKAIQAIKNI